ncbi:hypothetical protein [Endozoicomonas sp. ONNA1]|uniref:hypothetical protein n=1 Tax=Endozoicomonas sp. ONNA1 TaxID=2828740 RepID=UPI002148F0E5|nr:hypothetical protein [Endozoicomonas sp. ONNA1]
MFRKAVLLFVVLSSISFSAILQAQEELVYVLWSLNSRAEMYLVLRPGNDKPGVLLASIRRDMSIDEAYLDHVGNIASKRTHTAMKSDDYDPSRNTAAVARKMSREMLEEQKLILAQRGIDPAKTSASFLYAAAGFDATRAKEGDKLYTYYAPQDVIDIQKQAETAIKETFQQGGITLAEILTTRDTVLIGEAMKLMQAEDELFVLKTTYDLVCSMEQGELKTVDMKMPYGDDKRLPGINIPGIIPPVTPVQPRPVKKLPSGSVYSIGASASEQFFTLFETNCTDIIERCDVTLARSEKYMSDHEYKELASDASSCLADAKSCLAEVKLEAGKLAALIYLKKHIDPTTSDQEFVNRYAQGKRTNQLGHRILLLRLQDSYQAPAILKDWYIGHMQATMQPTLDEIQKRAAGLIAKAAKKGKSNPPHVYFLGEYAEINGIDFINALFRKHLQEWGLTYSIINKVQTSQLLVAGALETLDSLRQSHH